MSTRLCRLNCHFSTGGRYMSIYFSFKLLSGFAAEKVLYYFSRWTWFFSLRFCAELLNFWVCLPFACQLKCNKAVPSDCSRGIYCIVSWDWTVAVCFTACCQTCMWKQSIYYQERYINIVRKWILNGIQYCGILCSEAATLWDILNQPKSTKVQLPAIAYIF